MNKKSQNPESQNPESNPLGALPELAKRSVWLRLKPWIMIFLAALGIRCAYLWQVSPIPFFDFLVGDAASYDAWARDIASGNWLGDEVFYQAPGYPYFLAVIYSISGEANRLLTARLVQIVLGACACIFVGLATARLFSRKAGIVSGSILAFYPPAIFFDGLIQKASVNVALMSLCVWILLGLRMLPSLARWLGVGVVLGALCLTRENALALIPFVMAWLWWGFREQAFKIRARWFAGLLAGLFVVLFPVAIRNHHIGGEWLLTTSQAGSNFYIGNNANASGRYAPLVPGHETPEFERNDAIRLAQAATGKSLTPGEVSDFWFAQSKKFIAEQPLDWLTLLGKKLLLVVNRYEITDVEGYNVYCDFSPLLSVLSRFAHFGILCPLAIAGIVLAWPKHKGCIVLVVLPIVFAMSVAFFFVLARYRVPLVPMLLPFVGFAIVELHRRFRNRESLVAPAMAIIIATVICNWPINPEARLNAMAYFNLGTVLAEQGKLPAAIEIWEIALEENPATRELHYNLGMAHLLEGRVNKAIEHFSKAKMIEPDLVEVDHQLATAYESVGQLKKAELHFQEALRINPDDKQSETGLARVQAKMNGSPVSPNDQ